MSNDKVSIGLRVNQLRLKNGMTKRAFADSIGLDNSTLGKVEGGTLGLSKEAAMEIISKYNVTFNWLMFGQEETEVSTVENENVESLLLKIYENSLNAKAHQQATAEMVKEIYQVVMSKNKNVTEARYAALFSGFLLRDSQDQELPNKD